MAQTVLITGATSGIGRSTALLLGRKGYTVIAVGRDKEKLRTLKNNILNPSKHLFLECDVSDSKQLNKILSPLLEGICHLGIMLLPFMPEISEKIFIQLGIEKEIYLKYYFGVCQNAE